jgi:hypothetical protein
MRLFSTIENGTSYHPWTLFSEPMKLPQWDRFWRSTVRKASSICWTKVGMTADGLLKKLHVCSRNFPHLPLITLSFRESVYLEVEVWIQGIPLGVVFILMGVMSSVLEVLTGGGTFGRARKVRGLIETNVCVWSTDMEPPAYKISSLRLFFGYFYSYQISLICFINKMRKGLKGF